MYVTRVSLRNFRNYAACQLELQTGRNVLIGENAQGKTNFLEAIEFLATGRTPRADRDADLISWDDSAAPGMSAELDFMAGGNEESLRVRMARSPLPAPARGTKVEKQIAVNGVTQKSLRDLCGRLLVVSFASHDLNLLRGGPRFRRDWLDTTILKLRPAFGEIFSNYSKCVAQRNRLLKQIFEKGKVTVSDQDQLLAWDKQLARFGARIIKQRLALLAELLPLAEQHQSRLSRQHESLSIRYLFHAREQTYDENLSDEETPFESGNLPVSASGAATAPLSAAQLSQMEETELAATLARLLKERRAEEIRRKQTTVGPHRDDLVICLNDADAVSFASQGQQRSIVLSLKMSEVQLIRSALNDSPVLLLDDVLAELDEFRQGLLMGLVSEGLQTVITTTHVSGFDPRWLDGASIFKVHGGVITSPAAV